MAMQTINVWKFIRLQTSMRAIVLSGIPCFHEDEYLKIPKLLPSHSKINFVENLGRNFWSNWWNPGKSPWKPQKESKKEVLEESYIKPFWKSRKNLPKNPRENFWRNVKKNPRWSSLKSYRRNFQKNPRNKFLETPRKKFPSKPQKNARVILKGSPESFSECCPRDTAEGISREI